MKKVAAFLYVTLIVLCLAVEDPVRAAEIEVLRGEEEETEVVLEGTEEVYSIFGELECTEDYVCLLETEEKNSDHYQASEIEESGSSARLLLSATGADEGDGLQLRLKVKGIRIGTGTISFPEVQVTDFDGEWLEDVQIKPITVKVLPNPLEVFLSGKCGNGGWYVSTVEASVTDKDAAKIWYDLGEGKLLYTEPFEIKNGEWQLTVTSDDGYGYKKEEELWVGVDTLKPRIEASLEKLDWQQESIEVTVESKDTISGLHRSMWGLSEKKEICDTWQAFEGQKQLTIEADGEWYLHLMAEDCAGNRKETVYGPYRIDSEKPEIVFENLYQKELVEEEIVPKIAITDNCSGIKEVTYLLDGRSWEPSKISKKGTHVLTVTAEDYAGNAHTESVEFSIYDAITIISSASDTHYTGTASFSALVAYRGEPLKNVEAEFYINGEYVGARQTNQKGKVWLQLPIELPPQEAELLVSVAQDDEKFLLGGEDTCTFTVNPEKAWLLYSGDYSVRNGETFHVRLETGELPDYRQGDITKAEILVELYKIENDGSKTFTEELTLVPDESGIAEAELHLDTGLYELAAAFTKASCFTGKKVVLHPGVYEIDAALDWEGGSILLDLPHLGVYVDAAFTVLPTPNLEAQVEVRIPGTGITLTENQLTNYNLTADGLVLHGKALNPEDKKTYVYEIRTAYTMGIFLDELEVSIWKGEDKTKEPVYSFEWNAEESYEAED